jgi:hypothetical protein
LNLDIQASLLLAGLLRKLSAVALLLAGLVWYLSEAVLKSVTGAESTAAGVLRVVAAALNPAGIGGTAVSALALVSSQLYLLRYRSQDQTRMALRGSERGISRADGDSQKVE